MSARHIYANGSIDRLLICCPVVVPIVYLALIGQFPAYEALIFLAFLVLLGETHFGITWFFFLDRENIKWALRRPLYSVAIPTVMTVGFLAIFFFVDPALAMLLSSVFSAYHVTMQSVGVSRLYGGRNKTTDIAAKFIIGCSALFLFIGFVRFYNPIVDPKELSQAIAAYVDPSSLALVIIALIIAVVLAFRMVNRAAMPTNLVLTTITGALLYSPYLFASRPEHAIAMGVGMHWCQYLAITVPLYTRKRNAPDYRRTSVLGINMWQLLGLLGLYAVLMGYFRIDTGLTSLGQYDYSLSYLVAIPLIFQNLHYYSEMFTWKFSDPHIRERVGSFVFAPAQQPTAEETRERAATA